MKQRGFSLIELVIAMAVAAIIAMGSVQLLSAQFQVARAKKTASEMQRWLEAGMAYYNANNAWPSNQNVLVTAGFATTNDLLNPWGNPYQVAPVGGNLQVSTTFNHHPNIGVEALPNSSASGSVVTAHVVVPGIESAHLRFLNRYGDNGNNTMMANLDMNGYAVDNAVNVNIQGGQQLTVQGGDVAIHGATTGYSNTYGLTLKDADGTLNSAPKSNAGSANVNDLQIRSLTGNQWLSDRLSHYVETESYYVTDGQLVPKPYCPGGTQKIFLVPALIQIELGVTGTGSALFKANNVSPAFWSVTALSYGSAGPVAVGSALAKTYCYY